MDEKIESGAGPALAAHNKDGSTAGPRPASSKTGSAAGDDANSASSNLSGQMLQDGPRHRHLRPSAARASGSQDKEAARQTR